MKKLLVVLFSVLLLTTRVYAVSADDTKIDLSKYQTSNFRDILKEEEIKEAFDNYSESDDQVTIYLFRGHGCGYCKAFLTFLNSITKEYGKYFKVVGFEVWSDKENSKLLNNISTFMGSPAEGVPYIIIGDQVFPGYAETYDENIKATIKAQYDSKEKYDVIEEYNKAIDKAVKAAKGNAPTIIFWNFVFTAVATCIIVYYNKKQYNEILSKLDSKKSFERKEQNEKKKK